MLMTKPVRLLLVLVSAMGLVLSLAGLAALDGHTPPIRRDDGRPVPGSIAELSAVTLGGVRQWILIRGADATAPIVLKIHGGPGLAEMATRPFNAELEKHFVVVEWDQRGAGKSYAAAAPESAMTEAQLVDDTVELSALLRTRFHQNRIIIVGHSWGSLLAARAAAARPDLYCAYISTGQIVGYREGLGMTYHAMTDAFRVGGNQPALKSLQALGPPPYTDDGKRKRFFDLLKKSGGYWHAGRPLGEIGLMLKAPEYTLDEKVNFLAHAKAVQQKLMTDFLATDLRHEVPRIDVPVYFAEGRYDLTAPTALARAYFDALQAPNKQWISFDGSAHFPQWEEPVKFAAVVASAAKNRCG